MKVKIATTDAMDQEIDVKCFHVEEWNAYILSMHCESSYPSTIHEGRQTRIGEELNIAFNSQEEVENFISLVRKATKKIKGTGKKGRAYAKKSGDGTAS